MLEVDVSIKVVYVIAPLPHFLMELGSVLN
jgi:hypothetical protein